VKLSVKISPLIVLFVLLISGITRAQSIVNYSVGRTTGITYNSIISSGTSLAAWRYTGGFSEDDNRSEATDIGFDYWYNGQRYTQFSVSTNGFLDFSSSVDDGGPQCDDYGYCNFRFSSSNINNGTWLALAPFYDDMTTGGGADPLGSSIKYLLTGTVPNRVLTVEWDAMAVYLNTTPDINFQVKIYESTGEIEYLYETMDDGTNSFSYTIGINAETLSGPPTASELLTQQTANTTNFSNTAQNNLSTMPAANSQLTFTPPVPTNPGGSLSFTGISNTGMTLNWTDWATNEVGYVLYFSEDDVNFFFHSQVAANSTSAAVSSLLPSTTYYWRVYAVTEGTLSAALTGNATTLSPGTVTSLSNGRWDQAARWDCACVPTAADNVIVNHNVRISNANAISNDLTINPGSNGRIRLTGNTGRTLTVNGNLTVNSGARFVVANSSNTTHTLNIGGNISNDGIWNINKDPDSYCVVNFTKSTGNQLISGTGTNYSFYTLNIDKSLKSNILEVTSSTFSCNIDALSFTSGGTFKFSSSGVNSFSLFNTTKDIPVNGRIWMNSTGSTMNFNQSINLRGDLTLDAGIINIGDAANENLISFGGQLEINGGIMNIAGRYDRNNTESTSNFSQSSGTLALPVVGSTSTIISPFSMDVTGSSLTLSGGTIVLEREGGTGGQNLGLNTSGLSSTTVTGGTLQVGNGSTPAGQIITINSASSMGNLVVASANATGLLSSNLLIINDITLSSGVLDDGNNDISLGGDWLATGGSFVVGSGGSTTLNGGNQSITTAGSAFNHLVLDGSSNKSFQDNLDINGNLTNNVTLLPVNSGFQFNIGGNWTNNGTFTRNNETVIFDGSADQDISGTSTTDFTNLNINKSAGAVNAEATVNLFNTLDIQTPTVFDADGSGSGVFTLVSSAIDDARIAALTAGASISGNLVIEKYFAGAGIKYWRHISSAVLDATVADIQNEIPISGTFTGNDNGTGGIPANANPSLYRYDNNAAGATLDDRWLVHPLTTNTEVLTTAGSEARGYAIWVRETAAITYDLTGPVNQGNIDFLPSGANEGWNLHGNPYPSDIDWDNPGWAKTDIQGGAIHIWNGSQYLTWNGSTGSLGNGRIAKGQGFWIQASSGAVALSATESVKTATAATTYRTFTTENPQVIELSISAGGYSDQAYIQFLDSADFAFDIKDATKLSNSIFNLSTLSTDSVELSINVTNGQSCSFDMPISLSNTWNDTYSFNWIVGDNLLDVYSISLFDKFTNESYILDESTTGFVFEIIEDPNAQAKDRLYMHFAAKTIKEIVVTTSQLCDEINRAQITLQDSQFGVDYALLVDGEEITSLSGTGGTITYELDSNYLVSGVNNFSIAAISSICSDQDLLLTAEVDIIEQPEIIYDGDLNLLLNTKGRAGLWYKNGELLSESVSLTYIPDFNISGVYTLKVDNETCNLTSEEFLVTALEETSDANRVRISPNPTADYIVITAAEFDATNTTVSIADLNGRLYYNELLNVNNGNINIKHYKSGLYIVILSSNSINYRSRIVKY